jgi:DNA repair protein RadC
MAGPLAKSGHDYTIRPQRSDRIHDTLQVLLVQERFALSEVKQRLAGEHPAYVTRVVHQLERDGHLRSDDGVFTWTCELHEFPARAWIDGQVHGTQLQESPVEDRPRERLLAHGAAALRTAELLAILIRSGRVGESALQAGEKIASRYKDAIHKLATAGRGELAEIAAAIGETAYCQIMAGIELGRRVADAANQERPTKITGSDDAIAFCRTQFTRLATDGAREEFHIACLDTQYQLVGTHQISVGSLDRSLIHPREVFRPAIKDAAKAIILMHNHPSGDPTPSDEDLLVTKRLEEAGDTLGIQVLDHIVVARNGAVSIRESQAGRA